MIDTATTADLRRLMPGTEAVTYYRRTGEAAFTTLTVSEAKVMLLEKQVDQDGVILRQQMATVVFYRETLETAQAGLRPRVYDEFGRSDGTRWVIETATTAMLGNDFVCECRKKLTATG